MNTSEIWHLFMETGAPEVYLLYCNALKAEEKHVSDDPGDCPQSFRL